MEKKTQTAKWCPMGRVSIQRWEAGRFKEAVPGAYNLVQYVDRINGETGANQLYAVSQCLGENCKLFRRGLFGHGSCGLQSRDTGAWIFAALIILEIVAIAATFIFSNVLGARL